MRIRRLTVQNFRPYHGSAALDFGPNPGGGISFVHGPNGFGKTSLLFALNWCLYGHERARDAYELFNTHARAEPDPRMEVRLELDADGREIVINRSIQCLTPLKSYKDLPQDELTLMQDGQRYMSDEKQVVQERIDALIPREASQFAFFDGEKIEVYSSSNVSEATRDAIADVLGLSLFDRASEDLTKVSKDLKTERNKLLDRNQQGKNLAEDIQLLLEESEEIDGQLADAKHRQEELAKQERDLQDQLIQHESAKHVLEEVGRLEREIADLQADQEKVAAELKSAAGGLYLDILRPVLAELRAGTDAEIARIRQVQKQRIRGTVLRELLESLTAEGECLCGRRMESEHMACIVERFNELGADVDDLDGERESELAALGVKLDQALRLASSRATYGQLAARFGELENRLDEKETSRASYRHRLAGIDEEAIDGLNRALERVREDRDSTAREVGAFQKSKEDNDAERKKIESRIRKIEGQVSGLDLLNAEIDLLERSAAAYREILDRAALEKRHGINEAASAFFKEITNKQFGYDRMIINEDFTFGIETPQGSRPPMDLISAGEKQVTALSFILGLNEYTSVRAPIVMDTPMGRLDQIHRRNVATKLVELAEDGRQVILLVTDTDLAFGVEEVLLSAIEKEFELEHNQEMLTTSIRERVR